MYKRLLFQVVGLFAFSVATFAQSTWTGGSPVPIRQDGKPVVLERNPVPRLPDGKPDLSGVWANPSTDEGKVLTERFGKGTREPMALTPWAKERFDYNQDSRGGAREELKPERKCVPLNTAQLITGGTSSGAREFIQSPKRMLIFYQWGHNMRQIWTDGRKHPEEPDLTWLGDSIGKWDGDTLVVDTVGMRDEQWLDGGGHMHSTQLHIIERYKRLDNDTMEVELTFEDPKALTKPYTQRAFFRLRTDWDILEDMRCYVGSPDYQNQLENFQGYFQTE